MVFVAMSFLEEKEGFGWVGKQRLTESLEGGGALKPFLVLSLLPNTSLGQDHVVLGLHRASGPVEAGAEGWRCEETRNWKGFMMFYVSFFLCCLNDV